MPQERLKKHDVGPEESQGPEPKPVYSLQLNWIGGKAGQIRANREQYKVRVKSIYLSKPLAPQEKTQLLQMTSGNTGPPAASTL